MELLNTLDLLWVIIACTTAVHIMRCFSTYINTNLLVEKQEKCEKVTSFRSIVALSKLYVILGVFMFWLVWFGLNAGGFTLDIIAKNSNWVTLIIINTNLAAAAGGIFSLIIAYIKHKKFDIKITLKGILAGLVGVTAGCTIIDPWGAFIIGAICGITTTLCSGYIKKNLKIGDAVRSFSVYWVSGVIGTLLIGILSTENGILYGGGLNHLITQVIGAFSIAFWAIAVSFTVVYILKYTVEIRVTLEQGISNLNEQC